MYLTADHLLQPTCVRTRELDGFGLRWNTNKLFLTHSAE